MLLPCLLVADLLEATTPTSSMPIATEPMDTNRASPKPRQWLSLIGCLIPFALGCTSFTRSHDRLVLRPAVSSHLARRLKAVDWSATLPSPAT